VPLKRLTVAAVSTYVATVNGIMVMSMGDFCCDALTSNFVYYFFHIFPDNILT